MGKNGNSLLDQPALGAGTYAGTAGTSTAETDAYTYLRGVWNDHLQPTHIRMRAAAIGIEFERPRMAVSAVIESQDFAALLERRIKNFERINNGNGRTIEAQPVPQIETPRPKPEIETPMVKPHVIDRRFRRV